MSKSKLILNGAGWYIFTARPLLPEEREPLIYKRYGFRLWAWKSYILNIPDKNDSYTPLK